MQHWEEIIRKVHEPVVVVGGATPGHSTDFAVVTMCEDYQVPKMVNMTNIDGVFESDPKENPQAKPIEKIPKRNFINEDGLQCFSSNNCHNQTRIGPDKMTKILSKE